MTRFGVMKHLKVLEDAHPSSLQRWGVQVSLPQRPPPAGDGRPLIDPFLQPQPRPCPVFLKTHLENQTMTKPDFVIGNLHACTHDPLLDALTRAELIGVSISPARA